MTGSLEPKYPQLSRLDQRLSGKEVNAIKTAQVNGERLSGLYCVLCKSTLSLGVVDIVRCGWLAFAGQKRALIRHRR